MFLQFLGHDNILYNKTCKKLPLQPYMAEKDSRDIIPHHRHRHSNINDFITETTDCKARTVVNKCQNVIHDHHIVLLHDP